MTDNRVGAVRRLLAWGAHAFTASGAFFGFLALLAIEAGDFRRGFLWMGVTLVVDGADGALARRVGVKTATPRFDGFVVDCIVDYFTYVVLPVVVLYRSDVLPEGWRLAAAALVLVSSTYHYGNLDVKAPDWFFYGFPAWWNVLVFYLFLLHGPPPVNLAVVLAFVVLTPVPIKYIHPFRVRLLRPLNVAALVVWSAAMGWMVYRYPEPAPAVAAVSLAAAGYLFLLGVARTLVATPEAAGGETGGEAEAG